MADTNGTMRRRSAPAPEPQTLREWAQELAPSLQVVSASTPDATLEAGGLLAIFHSHEAARDLVLTWERIEPSDNAVGLVALGADPGALSEQERPTGPDPEGVGSHTIGRVVKGAIPGALVGGTAVGVTVAIISGWDGSATGAVLGGAAFGGVAGAFIAMVKGTGWGEAYEHSFVDPDATDVVVASFHSSTPGRYDEALEAARAADGARLAQVAGDGRVVPL